MDEKEDKKKTRGPAANLPEWLSLRIKEDVERLGVGTNNYGGPQRVYTLALMLYLSLPKEHRVQLALELAPPQEGATLLILERDWMYRAIQRVIELGEDWAEQRLFPDIVPPGGHNPRIADPDTESSRSRKQHGGGSAGAC